MWAGGQRIGEGKLSVVSGRRGAVRTLDGDFKPKGKDVLEGMGGVGSGEKASVAQFC